MKMFKTNRAGTFLERRESSPSSDNSPTLALCLSDDDGQALIEFALCLPVLLLLVTAIFAFGIAMNNYLVLTNAVISSAQQLAISRGQITDPCNTAITTLVAASPNLTSANLNMSLVLNGTSYINQTTCNSSSTTTGAAGQLVQGSSAQVKVTYPCSLLVYGANYVPGCTLSAQTTELVQ